MIVLPISADTYFNLMHVSEVKGSGSHAVKWRGASKATLTVRCTGHLWGQRRSLTGRVHLLQTSTLPRWKHRSAPGGAGCLLSLTCIITSV